MDETQVAHHQPPPPPVSTPHQPQPYPPQPAMAASNPQTPIPASPHHTPIPVSSSNSGMPPHGHSGVPMPPGQPGQVPPMQHQPPPSQMGYPMPPPQHGQYPMGHPGQTPQQQWPSNGPPASSAPPSHQAMGRMAPSMAMQPSMGKSMPPGPPNPSMQQPGIPTPPSMHHNYPISSPQSHPAQMMPPASNYAPYGGPTASHPQAQSGHMPNGDYSSQYSITGGIPNADSKLTPQQLSQLRAQIMAYRCIARNQPIPENISMALQGKRPLPYSSPPSHLPPQSMHPSMGGWRPPAPSTPESHQQRPQTPHQPLPQPPHQLSPASTPGPVTPSQPTPPAATSPMQPQSASQYNGQMGPHGLERGHHPGSQGAQMKPQMNGAASGPPPQPAPTSAPQGPSATTPETASQPLANGIPSSGAPPAQHPPYGPQNQQQQVNAYQAVSNVLNNPKNYRVTPISKPVGVDPLVLQKERENCISQRIAHRIHELSSLPANLPDDLRIKATIEYRALRLLNFQKQLRADVISCMRRDTTLETGQNPKLYRRPKRIGLREARITEKLEKQQKMEQERRRKQKHQEYISAILQHAKDFKEYHRNIQLKITRVNKAVAVYHANTEREQKKEQERIEKERMRRLMAEDEEGYRKLIDQKKDKRLAFLLSQTDEYIRNLTEMVKQHKEEQRRKGKERRKVKKKKNAAEGEASKDGSSKPPVDATTDDTSQHKELRVNVIESETGKMLTKEEAPLASELEAWLQAHPGWNVAPREEASSGPALEGDGSESEYEEATESETDDEEKTNAPSGGAGGDSGTPALTTEDDEYKGGDDQVNYYNIAHGIRERITEQSSLLRNGKLKEYQVHGLEWLVSLYNNNLNGILADEMGLGKTIQTIALITYLIEKKRNNGPYLIIVPLSTMSNWMLEFERWAPTVIKIAYKGKYGYCDEHSLTSAQVPQWLGAPCLPI